MPLIVITELDGLKNKTNALGTAATQAISYLESSIKSFPSNLKIQTSRGNFLRDLKIRSEDIIFASSHSSSFSDEEREGQTLIRSMDDVIVQAAVWQEEHWMDRRRSLMFNFGASATANAVSTTSIVGEVPQGTPKTVLVSGDRNLRLKARARGIEVTDAKELEKMTKEMEQKRPDG